MRFTWLLLVVFLLLMPLQQCEGCSKPYSNLANHVKRCANMRQFISGGLKNRMQQTSRAEADRLAEAARLEQEQARVRAEAALREAELRAREEVSLPAVKMPSIRY